MRKLLLALALLVPSSVVATVATVAVTAAPAAADDHGEWHCYESEHYSGYSTWDNYAPGAWYVTDYYDRYWTCSDGSSGYSGRVGYGYYVFDS